jgi:hypothetical protein
LRAWLDYAAIDEGRVFRAIDRHGNLKADPLNGETIAAIVKRRSAAVGLDPDELPGHSLSTGSTTERSTWRPTLPSFICAASLGRCSRRHRGAVLRRDG